jgi:hypothetical protein
MLTIENIHKISLSTLRVAGEKWELSDVKTARDLYQFVYRCIELNPTTIGTKVLGREAVVNLCRAHTKEFSIKVYELKCVTNGRSRVVGLPDLKAPGALIGPMLRVIEGC